MEALNIILQVTLLLSSLSFIKSSDTLQCFNDYCSELKCILTLPQGNCTEFSLNASLMITKIRNYTCRFNETRPGACECTMHVQGFVVTEMFTLNLLKGKNLWLTENISTEQSIKPRRPIIVAGVPKPNGDFTITLNTTYKKSPFSDSLMVELTYGVKGSHESVSKILGSSLTTYEILGRNLQPDSTYILKARVKSGYHNESMFSDYSEPYIFKTPTSLLNRLKIIIPILCILLVICLSSIYFWFDRIVKPWWDKVPTPKFSTKFVKQVPWLMSLQTEFSSVSVDSRAISVGKKTSVESSQVQHADNQYNVCPGKCDDSASDDYTTVCHGTDNARVTLKDKENQSTNLFNSGISNKSYFFKHQAPNGNQKENFPLLTESRKILTEFEYSMWNGCTDSGTSKLIQVTPLDDETVMVIAYDSVDDHNALSSCRDQIREEEKNIKKPQEVPFFIRDSIVAMPMEDEYQVI